MELSSVEGAVSPVSNSGRAFDVTLPCRVESKDSSIGALIRGTAEEDCAPAKEQNKAVVARKTARGMQARQRRDGMVELSDLSGESEREDAAGEDGRDMVNDN